MVSGSEIYTLLKKSMPGKSETLHLDPNNYRIHDERNKRVIKKSLEDCGAARSIVADKENVIIAGNGVYEQAKALGIPIRFVETNGKELVVVKRTDISTDDERRKLLALADNYSSDTSIFDMEAVLEDFSMDDLDLWEFSLDDIEIDTGEINESDHYTKKIEAPTYEPKNEKPQFDELSDNTWAIKLISDIEKSSLSKKEKEFLKLAAQRHIVFNYEKIADFYANSSKECQELMEDSVLVIIDFEKALELNYVKLSEEIANQYLKDYEE